MHAELSQPVLRRNIPRSSVVPTPLAHLVSHLSDRPREVSRPFDTAPLLVALLMDKPHTAAELAAHTGIHISTVKRWLAAFEGAGVITFDPHPTKRSVAGKPVAVWRMHLPRTN